MYYGKRVNFQEEEKMLGVMSRYWWVLGLRGALAILFGILILVLPPAVSITSIVTLFGAYAIVDGIFTIMHGFRERATNRGWWAQLLEGFVGIIAGIAAFAYPGVTALVMLYIVAGWAVITGVLEIVAAIRLREEIQGEFWLGLSGLLSVVFGVLLVLMNPINGILTLLWLVAVYAIAFGVMMVLLAFRVRGMGGSSATPRMA
jgi:uncharacterized membrane protein HdeD (DUF308 family)